MGKGDREAVERETIGKGVVGLFLVVTVGRGK